MSRQIFEINPLNLCLVVLLPSCGGGFVVVFVSFATKEGG